MAAVRALMASWRVLLLLAIVAAGVTPALGQRPRVDEGGVYKSRIAPHWFDDSTRFWYRNDLRGGRREFIVVDAEQGSRRQAFDHDKLAEALKAADVADIAADRLPFDAIELNLKEGALKFRGHDRGWKCDLQTYALSADESPPLDNEKTAAPDAQARSRRPAAGE